MHSPEVRRIFANFSPQEIALYLRDHGAFPQGCRPPLRWQRGKAVAINLAFSSERAPRVLARQRVRPLAVLQIV